MISIKHVGLLVLLLMEIQCKNKFCPPNTCKCDFNGVSTCNLNNSTITLEVGDLGSAQASLTANCKGTKFTCSDLPEFGSLEIREIFVTSCSPRILRCLNEILVDPVIGHVYLSEVDEPLVEEDVGQLEKVVSLTLGLKDTNTTISTVSINSFPILKQASISKGYLNLTEGRLIQKTLQRVYFFNTRVSSMPAGAFTGLSNLDKMVFAGGNVETGTIGAGAFKSIPKLRDLQMNSMGIKTIEKGAFSNAKNITLLYFNNNPFESLPNGFLEGVEETLTSISIACSPSKNETKLNLGSYAFANLSKLVHLEVTSCRLSELQDTLLKISNIKEPSALKEIILSDNNINKLTNGIFANLISLVSLNLANNEIVNLHEDIFKDLISLNELVLTNNNIQELPEEIFSSLTSLVNLHLDNNKIQELSEYTFSNLTSLDTLELSHNSIDALPQGIFNSLTSLTTLYLDNNKIQILPTGIFTPLSSLATLNLENNMLTEVSKNTFGLSLIWLSLANNSLTKLDDMAFANMSSLNKLYLNDNKIVELNVFDSLQSLLSLNLANNELTSLPSMKNIETLYKLDLSSNKLSDDLLDTGLYYVDSLGVHKQLRELNLRNNKITSLGANPDGYSVFSEMKELNNLDLSGNEIRHFFAHWDKSMTQVNNLNLSRNHIVDFTVFRVDYTNISILIDLEFNKMSEILLDPRISNSSNPKPTRSFLYLNNNPIICDCNSYGLVLRSKGAKSNGDPRYFLDDARCTAPENLKGKLLKDVEPMDLICDLNKYRPEHCSRYIMKPAINQVFLHCSKMPSPFPDVTSVNVTVTLFDPPEFVIKLDNQPDKIENLNIHSMNLSNIGMRSIDFNVTNTSLKILDLSRNNLSTVPEDIFSTNISLYLSSNPLQCICSLVTKLKKYSALADSELVMCANEGKNLKDVDADEICNRTDSLISFVGTTAVIGLICIIIAIAGCKYLIKNWSDITRSVRRRNSNTVALERTHCHVPKKYDIFISFPYQDEEFVRENLLPKLQYEFNKKVCVQYRDWTVENLSPEQIRKSVDDSSNIIIILSEHFLTSEWCYLEFARAHTLSKQDGVPRVIIVSLTKEIIKEEGLSDELKSYLDTDSHLLWGDPSFWKRMKDVLPK